MGKNKWTPAKRRKRTQARKAPVEGGDNDAEYELEVLRTRMVKGVEESLVHWVGWDSQYDEWIPSASIHRVRESKEGEEEEEEQEGEEGQPMDDVDASEKKKGKAKAKEKEREHADEEEHEEEEEEEDKAAKKQSRKRRVNPQRRRARKSSTLKEDEEEEEAQEEEEENDEEDDEDDENYGESVNGKGSPRKRMWTDQELDLLEQATEEASRPDSVSWVQVASQVGNRTPRSCKRRWQRLQACRLYYKSPRQLEKRKEMIKESRTRPWTEQEEAKLLKEVAKKGLHYESDTWVALESKFKRSAGALQLRWSELHNKRGGAVSLSDDEGREDFDDERRGRNRAPVRRSLEPQSSSEASASEGESNHRAAAVPMEASSDGDDQREKEKEKEENHSQHSSQRARYQRKQRPSNGARKSFALSRAPYPLGNSQETAGGAAGDAESEESPRQPRSKGRSPVASQKNRSDDDDDDEEDEGVEEERKRRTKKRRKKARKERERHTEETDSPHISLDEMDSPVRSNSTGADGERTTLDEEGDGEASVARSSPFGRQTTGGESEAEAKAGQGAGESEGDSEEEAARKKQRRKITTRQSDDVMQLDDSSTTKGRKSKATRAEEGEKDSLEAKERRKEREKKQAEDLHAWVERQRELNLERFGQRTLTPRLSGKSQLRANRRRTIAGHQRVDHNDDEPAHASEGIPVRQRGRRHSVTTREDAGEHEELEVDDFLMGKRRRESSSSSGESSDEQNRRRKRARTTAPAAAKENSQSMAITVATHHDYGDSEEEDMESVDLALEKEKRTIARFEKLARERRQALDARRRRDEEDEGEEDEDHEDEEREIIERIESVVTKKKKAVLDRVSTQPIRTEDNSEWQVVFGVDDAADGDAEAEMEAAVPEPNGESTQRKQAERDVIADIEQAVRRKRRQSLKAEQLRERREREAAAEVERQRELQEEVREETTKIEKLLTKKRRQSMTALREKHNRDAIASAMRGRRRWTLGGPTSKLEGDEGDAESEAEREEEEEEEEEVDRVVDELKSVVERQRREQDAARRKRLELEQRREAEKRAIQIEERESVEQLCRYWRALHQRG